MPISSSFSSSTSQLHYADLALRYSTVCRALIAALIQNGGEVTVDDELFQEIELNHYKVGSSHDMLSGSSTFTLMGYSKPLSKVLSEREEGNEYERQLLNE